MGPEQQPGMDLLMDLLMDLGSSLSWPGLCHLAAGKCNPVQPKLPFRG